LDRRQIHTVVPARDGLVVRDLALLLDPQVPPVRRDVLEQLLVLAGKRELDASVGAELREPRRRVEGEHVVPADPIEQILGRPDRWATRACRLRAAHERAAACGRPQMRGARCPRAPASSRADAKTLFAGRAGSRRGRCYWTASMSISRAPNVFSTIVSWYCVR